MLSLPSTSVTVRSIRGAGGGYQFCGHARRSMFDLNEMFEHFGPLSADKDESLQGTAECDALRTTARSITITTLARVAGVGRNRQATSPGRGGLMIAPVGWSRTTNAPGAEHCPRGGGTLSARHVAAGTGHGH